jgi:hypothetical protein
LQKIYTCMRSRCYNEKHQNFSHYGGRGITIADEWKNFKLFKTDMLESFIEHAKINGLENTKIDRKDVNKGYSKNNCVWSTQKEQANNKRNNVVVVYKGETMTLSQLSELTDIEYKTLWYRVKRLGMDGDTAIETPLYKSRGKHGEIIS